MVRTIGPGDDSSIKDQKAQKRLQRRVQKAEASDVLEVPKLVSVENGEPTILRRYRKAQPSSEKKKALRSHSPLLLPPSELGQ